MKNLKISKRILASLLLISSFAFSGCNDADDTNNKTPETSSPTVTLTAEEQKVVGTYIKPTTDASGNTVEAIDPLVELLSE